MALHTLFLPRRRMSLQSVNCSSVNSCLESKSLNSSIGKLMISRTLIGKLKPNARRSSRDSCDTLIPGGKPAMLAAASAAKDFRFRSLLEDPDPEPEGPGNPADDELADIVDPMWAIWPPEIKLSFGGKIQIGNWRENCLPCWLIWCWWCWWCSEGWPCQEWTKVLTSGYPYG